MVICWLLIYCICIILDFMFTFASHKKIKNMAIIENKLLKDAHGRIDDLLIYQRNGRTCMRRMPERVELTPGMLEQQERFAGVAALWGAVKANGWQGAWQDTAKEKGMAGYNLFTQVNCQAFTGEGTVGDYRRLMLTAGKLQLPDNMRLVKEAEAGAGAYELLWDNDVAYPNAADDDRLVVALMREGREISVQVPDIGDWRRKHCRAVIRLPTELQGYTHLYCLFCSATSECFSWSRYFLSYKY